MKKARHLFVCTPIQALLRHCAIAAPFALVALSGRAYGQAATPPSTGTNIGSSPVGTAASQVAVTFTIGTGGSLGTTKVLTTGIASLDFTLGTGSTCTGTVAAGSCVVNVAFTPKTPGQRIGAVELTNSSGTVIATALIYGTGTGPLVTVNPGTISTIAGTGTAGTTVGSTAAATQLDANQGIAVDAAGNVFIANYAGNTVFKISGTSISTYAGGGSGGNGGAATSASLNGPAALALDGAGNLYIVESNAGDVRVVTQATGLISTFPGATGGSNPNGIALDTSGNIYVAGTGGNVVDEVTTAGRQIAIAGTGTSGFSGDGAAATSALLNGPEGIGLDAAGNVYIADTGNQRIRKVTLSTGIITTVAGSSTTAGFSGDGAAATSATLNIPRGSIAIDAAGDFFFADAGNNRVRKVLGATQVIRTVAGSAATALGDGGAATKASLNYPIGVALDNSGNLYISDSNNARLREVTASGAPIAFASTQVNSVSSDSPQTVTLANLGNAALTFSVPASGTNPALTSGYTLGSSSTCPQISSGGSTSTLASGNSCTDSISFAPTVVSSTNSGTLVTTDNNLNVAGSTQSVSLSGVSTGTTTTTSLGVSPSSGVLSGGTVTLTATVSPSGATGTVIFYDQGAAVSSAVTVSGGTASASYTNITKGSHSLTAVFTGTGVYATSTSAATALTVTTATTTTVSASPASRVISGQTVALTATISPSAATGSVVFSDNGTALSGAVTVSNGTATYSDTNITAGSHSFTAAFTGTSGYNNSTSAATALTVTGPATQLIVTGVPTSAQNSVGYTYTVTAEDANGNIVTGFTGSVTSTSTDALATLSNASAYTFVAADNGVHTFTVAFATAGTQSLTVTSGSITSSATGIVVNDALLAVNANGTVSQLSENGTAISPSAGFTGGGAPTTGLAVDASGNYFSLLPGSNLLAEFNRSGTALSGSGYTGGGLSTPSSLAIDGAGSVWIANGNGSVSLFSNAGVALSPSTGYASTSYSSPTGITIDISGNVWVANGGNNSLVEILGAAAPVAPISTAVTNLTLGARP